MIFSILLPVMAGLAIFLFGMKLMEVALQHWAGPYLRGWLERFTRTPWRGMLAGTVLTAVLQSSTTITVITIGLVNAGVLGFSSTLGIILGSNIGTCLSTELIGSTLSGTSLPLLGIGAAAWVASWLAPHSRGGEPGWLRSLRCASLALAGFALVLLGVETMQTIGPALRERGLFAWFVAASQQSLLWGVVAGACVTALVHSSAATIAMTMGLASASPSCSARTSARASRRSSPASAAPAPAVS
jgi:phosphate:Na+ symporter